MFNESKKKKSILNHLKIWNAFGWLASQNLKQNLENKLNDKKFLHIMRSPINTEYKVWQFNYHTYIGISQLRFTILKRVDRNSHLFFIVAKSYSCSASFKIHRRKITREIHFSTTFKQSSNTPLHKFTWKVVLKRMSWRQVRNQMLNFKNHFRHFKITSWINNPKTRFSKHNNKIILFKKNTVKTYTTIIKTMTSTVFLLRS